MNFASAVSSPANAAGEPREKVSSSSPLRKMQPGRPYTPAGGADCSGDVLSNFVETNIAPGSEVVTELIYRKIVGES